MNLLVYSVPIVILLIIAEILWSMRRKNGHYRVNDTISNITAGMIQQLFSVLPMAVGLGVYQWIYAHAALFPEILARSAWYSWVLLFFLEDFKYYWFHRAAHRVALLWSSHVVHHQSEEYNLSVALRQSTLQDWFALVFAWPFALLGFDPLMYVTIHLLNLLGQFWIHTRAIRTLPSWIEAWLNTPSHHRVHHGRNESYIDTNYAGILIVWDRMFGTFAPEKEEVVYGVTVPTQSWNPLRAQFESLIQLLSHALRQTHWSQRWRVIFGPPGWSLENPSGKPQFVPRPKYDVPLDSTQTRVAVLSFAIMLLLTFLYLLAQESLSIEGRILIVATLVGGLRWLGNYLDGRVTSTKKIRQQDSQAAVLHR